MNLKLSRLLVLALISCGVLFLSGVSSHGAEAVTDQLSASIGGFGNSYKVELRDGLVWYTATARNGETKLVKITPTPEQWEEFWKAMETQQVWQWLTEYANTRVSDGTQWTLNLRHGTHQLTTLGSNNYPGKDGEPNAKPEQTKEFKNYLAAIKKLLGGRAFE
jgi:hypothetical protein